jgi:uncharacterized membrane protein YccC
MEYSLPAWLGGLIGTVIAVAIYIPAIRVIEARLREQNGPQTLEQRAAFDEKMSIARRVILGITVVLLATIGYMVGNKIFPTY